MEVILIFDKRELKMKNIRDKVKHNIKKCKHHEHKNTNNIALKYTQQELTKLLEKIHK